MVPFNANLRRSEIHDPTSEMERAFMYPLFANLRRSQIRDPRSEMETAFMYPSATKPITGLQERNLALLQGTLSPGFKSQPYNTVMALAQPTDLDSLMTEAMVAFTRVYAGLPS